MTLKLKHINVSGSSSSSFCSSISLCYVDWGGAALYLHGSYLRDDHPWHQLKMVVFLLQNLIKFHDFDQISCVCNNVNNMLVKVSWHGWYEAIKNLHRKWGCHILFLAGGSNTHNFDSFHKLYTNQSRLKAFGLNLFTNKIKQTCVQVARILLFIYLFYHVYLHYDQVRNNIPT